MSSEGIPSTREIELETLLRQREGQNEQLMTEITMLRRHLVKQPLPSNTETITLPPAYVSLLLPVLTQRGGDGLHGADASHSAGLALTQRAKLLQEENDELYELLKHSETGRLMEEVRGLRRTLRRLEGALRESHGMINSLSTELDKCYETISRQGDGYNTRQGHGTASGNNTNNNTTTNNENKNNNSVNKPIPTGPRKRARVSPGPGPPQQVRGIPPTGPSGSGNGGGRGSGSGSPRGTARQRMEVDDRSPDRYRRRRRSSRERSGERESERERERVRDRDRERDEREHGRRQSGRERDRRVGGSGSGGGGGGGAGAGAGAGGGGSRGLAERMGL